MQRGGSPRVRHRTDTREPASAKAARTVPSANDSSSGWATTASTERHGGSCLVAIRFTLSESGVQAAPVSTGSPARRHSRTPSVARRASSPLALSNRTASWAKTQYWPRQ